MLATITLPTLPPFYLDDLRRGDSFTSGEHAMDEAQIIAFAAQFDPQPFHLDHDTATGSMLRARRQRPVKVAPGSWHGDGKEHDLQPA